MPIPDKNESEKKFMSRCIPIVMNEGTTDNPSQAAAICHSLFKQHHKKAKSSQELIADSIAEKVKELTKE